MDFDRSTVREEFWSFELDLGTAGCNFASDEQNRRSKETCVDKTKWRQMLRLKNTELQAKTTHTLEAACRAVRAPEL